MCAYHFSPLNDPFSRVKDYSVANRTKIQEIVCVYVHHFCLSMGLVWRWSTCRLTMLGIMQSLSRPSCCVIILSLPLGIVMSPTTVPPHSSDSFAFSVLINGGLLGGREPKSANVFIRLLSCYAWALSRPTTASTNSLTHASTDSSTIEVW